jgi:hypothetical protein
VPFKTGLAPPLCLSACNEPGKGAVMYLFAKGVDISFFYGFGNGFWYCSYSVVLFVHVLLLRKVSVPAPHKALLLIK